MGDGPNGSAKWAKYSVSEDAKLEKRNFVQFVSGVFLAYNNESLVAAADILK